MTTITALQPAYGKHTQAIQEALDKLSSGPFRAVVLRQTGSQILLDTAFGKFSGQTSTQLSPGVEIQARLTGQQNGRQLQILQVHNASAALRTPDPGLRRAVENASSQMLVAQVVRHQSGQTLLHAGREIIAIERQPALNTGDRVLIKPTAQGPLQLERLNIQELLRQSLYKLTAQNAQPGRPYNLSTLHRFAGELNHQRIEALITRANQKATEITGQTPADAPARPSISAKTITQHNTNGLNALIRGLLNLQQSALKTHPQDISAQGVRDLLLLAVSNRQGSAEQPPLSRTLSELFNVLKQHPESIRLLIERMLSTAQNNSTKTQQSNAAIESWSSLLRLELMQHSEQTLNQLLTQQTGARLQVEQNQPLQIQLNLPLVLEQTSRDLKLSVTQRQPREEDEYQEGWDIQLSFEFGLLGLISTSVRLRDKRVSAEFWAALEPTRNLIEHNFGLFRQQLLRQGFEPGDLNALLGKPPEQQSKTADLLPEQFLDVQA